MKRDDYRDRARAMLRENLAQSNDPAVQAINAAFDPSEEAVERVAAALRAQAGGDG